MSGPGARTPPLGRAQPGPAPEGAERDWRASATRAAIVCVLLSLLLWAWSRLGGAGPQLHGQALSPRAAPVFTGLTDTQGHPFSWRAQRGDAVLVFFGYTHCPDVCPLTLARLSRVIDGLGPQARRVRVVFVTLDPQRDTPTVLRAYLDALLPGAVGLRGDAADTARAAAQWGVHWRRVSAPGAAPADYWIDHTAALTLVGPRGHLRARYGYAQLESRGLLQADLRSLLERRAAAPGA